MADNVAVTEGSGVSIAADEILSVKYQRVKLIQGADGVNDGDVSSAAPLQVTLANTGANATRGAEHRFWLGFGASWLARSKACCLVRGQPESGESSESACAKVSVSN